MKSNLTIPILLAFPWKWLFFGATLWALYFIDRRGVGTENPPSPSKFEARRGATQASRFGLILLLFAFLLSPSSQWIHMLFGVGAGAALGLLLGQIYHRQI